MVVVVPDGAAAVVAADVVAEPVVPEAVPRLSVEVVDEEPAAP